MATPIRTDYGTVCLAIKNKLITDNIFSPTTCYISFTPESPKFPNADQFAVIAPGGQLVEQPMVAGGGNTAFFLEGNIDIYLWSRLATDELNRDENWFTDQGLGWNPTLRKLISSLQLYQLVNQNGEGLIDVPLKLKTIEPGKRMRAGENVGWGYVKTSWRIKWWFSLIDL